MFELHTREGKDTERGGPEGGIGRGTGKGNRKGQRGKKRSENLLT